MSGSGGGMPYYATVQPSCEDLSIIVTLASPVASVIINITIGELLNVSSYSITGPIQIKTELGSLAGSILSGTQNKLLECLNNGTEYIAEVIEVNGGLVKVKIYHS